MPDNQSDQRLGSVLVDFDGTACAADVTSELCRRFAEGDWQALDKATYAGSMSLREAIHCQAAMLRGSRAEMLDWVLRTFSLDPSFGRFVQWADASGVRIAVVSDGFGFFIRSMLDAAGLQHVGAYANEISGSPPELTLLHAHQHAWCRVCGTCKMRCIVDHRAHGDLVAFCGDGQSDMFAALYADIVFAKGRLQRICEMQDVAYTGWQTFDDVIGALARERAMAPRRSPTACPGMRNSHNESL